MSYERRWSGRLSIRHDAVMDVQVLTLEGELTLETLPDARTAVRTALAHAAPLVLDLRLLRAVDRPGVELLASAARRAADGEAGTAMVPPEDVDVWRALTASGLQ